MYNITDEEYYNNNGVNPTVGNQGSYQYVSLEDAVTNYMAMFVGNDKLINRVERHDIIFFAKQAIQKFSYDALNAPRVLELTIDHTGSFVAPPDFVGMNKISLEQNGILFPMQENVQQISSGSYLQDVDGELIFDVDGYVIETSSALDEARVNGLVQRLYMGGGLFNNTLGWCVGGVWYFSYGRGGIYNLQPDTANINPTYRFDRNAGVFYFSSNLIDQHVVLEYTSDGLKGGDDSKVQIHKFAEDYLYTYISWSIMNIKRGYPEYQIKRYKTEMQAYRDNAKIRLGRNKMCELLMTLQNQTKWLK